MEQQLIKLDRARQWLAEVRSIDEVKDIRDKAQAMAAYACTAKLGLDAQNDAAEIKIRAERRCGELLAEFEQRRGATSHHDDERSDFAVAVSSNGLNSGQVSRWQTIAEIPSHIFDEQILKIRADRKEITSYHFYREGVRIKNSQKAAAVTPQTQIINADTEVIIGDANKFDLSQFSKRYGVIVADPPWAYRVSKGQGVAKDEYSTMTDDDIMAMPVGELALDNSVLFLWGTWPKLPEALGVMIAWGFEYVTGFPWVKLSGNGDADHPTLSYGVGYWVRGCSEYIIVGRRGKINTNDIRMKGFIGIVSPNLQHSRKPEDVHQLAEILPGPRLELFARRGRIGWTVYVNQIQAACV